MGCKCCKMIQSYLCDPAQAPSPDYVSEGSISKLDEDHTVKLKGCGRNEILVHKNVFANESLRRTDSRGGKAGLQETCGPHQGSLSPADTEHECCAKSGASTNGIGPRASLQPLGSLHTASQPSSEDGIHQAQLFLEGRDVRSQDYVLPTLEETPDVGLGDCGAPAEIENPVLEGQDWLPLPAPDYPPLWDPAAENHREVGDEDEAVAEALAALEAATAGEDVDQAD